MHARSFLFACASLAFLAAGPASAGTEQVIHDFLGSPTDGFDARGGLLAIGGVLYGTTVQGGAVGNGTVYAVTAQGSETVLHSFAGGADGGQPVAGLFAIGQTLYGTTFQNTAFTATISGTESTFAQFSAQTGTTPVGRLVRLGGGLYGLANTGGVGGPKTVFGTLYKIGDKGAVRAVYTFRAGSDGASPYGDLLLKDGAFYGTTLAGGSRQGFGTVFKITPDGQETVLHAFQGTDGAQPLGGLIDVGGTLYGTTASGGSSNAGTVFKIATDDTFTSIHSFGGDASGPFGNLANVGGTLYGATRGGGTHQRGTIFTVSAGDAVSVVYSFPCCGKAHGEFPSAGLTLLNGALYGTTAGGGAAKHGTVFRYRP